MDVEKLAYKIKEAVEWLKEEDCGCSTIKLDDKLAVCVGWSDGWGMDDETLIHSKTQPTWVIEAGIKVWTSDSLRTDYDFINFPYFEHGDVWNTSCSISKDEDYTQLATWFLKEYENMLDYDIEDDGKIYEF